MSAGVSLAELARRTHYSKGYLSKVETGARPPTAAVARLCDAALEADGTLIALVGSPDGGDPHSATSAMSDGDVWVLGMSTAGSVWFQPMQRRKMLAAGAASLLTLSVAGSRIPSRGQPDAVLRTWSEVFGQIRALGQQAGPEVVLPTLIAATHTLQQIAVTTTARTRRECYVLASRYAEFAGWMAQEAGLDSAALWWTDQAVKLASAGGDHELAAYALVRRALIELYAGDALHTISLARQAQREPAASDRIRGLAAQREAQGHALAGDYPNCQRALERAETWLEQTTTGPGPILGSATVNNTVGLTTAWCLHDLGRPAQAAELLDRELGTVPPTAHRFHARWGARRALAYATSGELDHTCDLSRSLLADLAIADSATVRSDVRTLTRTLRRWLTHPPVRQLYPELTAALHRPTTPYQ